MGSVLISCNNKGCYSSDYHKLDNDTDQVVCINCGNNISNVSSYIKRTMRDFGQIFKRARTTGELKCKSCGFTALPVIVEHEGGLSEIACASCKTPDAYLTRYFLEPLKLRTDIVRVKPEDNFESVAGSKFITEQLDPVQKALKGTVFSPKRSDRPVVTPTEQLKQENSNAPKNKAVTPKKTVSKSRAKVKTPGELLQQAGFKSLKDEFVSDDSLDDSKKRPKISYKNTEKNSAKTTPADDKVEAVEII